MTRLEFQLSSRITLSAPVSNHSFLLHILPYNTPEQQIVAEQVEVVPSIDLHYNHDAFGSRTLSGYIAAPHNEFSYRCVGTLLRDDSKKEKAEAFPCYRYASALTKPSRAILEWLGGISITGNALTTAQRLQQAVYDHFIYASGVTTIKTTAAEAFDMGRGVCQDYAHVFLAAARAMGLTARYVYGLTVGEGATHAWCEVQCDGIWRGFDPTRNVAVDESYLVIAVGRDYNDCAPERGVFYGAAAQLQSSFMKVKRIT